MDEVRVPCNSLGTPATSHRLVFDYFGYFPPYVIFRITKLYSNYISFYFICQAKKGKFYEIFFNFYKI